METKWKQTLPTGYIMIWELDRTWKMQIVNTNKY